MEKTKDFTSGSVLGSLIKFAIPVLAAMFLQALASPKKYVHLLCWYHLPFLRPCLHL